MARFNPNLEPLVVNVKDYGEDVGVTKDGQDDTAAIAAAITAASINGNTGIVFFPAGTYISRNQTIASNVYLHGTGVGATTIKLKDGANTDLFSALTSSINLSAAAGASSNTAITFFGFSNMTLDGNKAKQTSGTSYPIRVYGHRHLLEHVEIKNGYSGGILMDYNGTANPTAPADAFMPRWYDVMVHDCNGIGIEVGGPTDMQWIGVNAYASGSHVCHIAPNAVALRMTHCHFWATPTGSSSATLLNEAAELVLTSCQIEGSDTCALVLLGNDCQGTALEVGNTGDTTRQGRGIQLGQGNASTLYAGMVYQSGGHTTAATANVCHIAGKAFECRSGVLDEQNTTGNIYSINAYQGGGTAIASNGGYPVAGVSGFLEVNGLTADGTPGKGGFFQLANSSYYGMQAIDTATNNIVFSLDTFGHSFQIKNGYNLATYTDNGTTYANSFQNNANGQLWFGNGFDTYVQKGAAGVMRAGTAMQLGTGSTLYSGSGAPSNSNGANGDYYFRTDTPGTANQRIYVKAAGAWSGIV